MKQTLIVVIVLLNAILFQQARAGRPGKIQQSSFWLSREMICNVEENGDVLFPGDPFKRNLQLTKRSPTSGKLSARQGKSSESKKDEKSKEKRKHLAIVVSLVFSRDGKTLVTGNYLYKGCWVWDVSTKRDKGVFAGHSLGVESLAYSHTRNAVVSGSADGSLFVWETGVEKREKKLAGHEGWVTAVAVSPNGEFIASAGQDRTVRLWDSTSLTPFSTLHGHKHVVRCVAFSPNNRTLASAGWSDQTVRLWDVATGRCQSIIDEDSPTHVVYSPDGSELITVSQEKGVAIWEVATKKLRMRIQYGDAQFFSIAFSPDGKYFFLGCEDRKVRAHAWPSGKLLTTIEGFPHPVKAIAVSPDSSLLAVANADLNDLKGGVSLHAIPSGKRLGVLR